MFRWPALRPLLVIVLGFVVERVASFAQDPVEGITVKRIRQWGAGRGRQNLKVSQLRGGGWFSCCFGQREDPQDFCHFHMVLHYTCKDGGEQYEPAVLGSAPSLGQWDPKRAVMLTKGPGEVRWSASVRFPKRDGRFEFKYVLVPRKGGKGPEPQLQWEFGHNREVRVTARGQVELGNDSTMPHHLRHASNAAPPCVSIDFLAHYTPQHASQTVSLVGSHEELGGWDPSKAIPLTRGSVDKQNRAQWRIALSLPFPLLVEFKFLRVDEARGEVVWQAGGNRHCMINPDGQFFFYPDRFGVSFSDDDPASPPRRQLSGMALGLRGDPALPAMPSVPGAGGEGGGLEGAERVKRMGSMQRLQEVVRAMVGAPGLQGAQPVTSAGPPVQVAIPASGDGVRDGSLPRPLAVMAGPGGGADGLVVAGQASGR